MKVVPRFPRPSRTGGLCVKCVAEVSEVEIRQAREDDVDLLARLNHGVQGLHAAAHPHLFKVVGDDRPIAAWFATFLARPEARVLIGTVGEEAVGYITGNLRQYPDNPFRHPLTIGVIDQLAITPGARRRGYGEGLLDALLAHFRQVGVDRVELSVWAFNEEARDFYLRRGFAIAYHAMSLAG